MRHPRARSTAAPMSVTAAVTADAAPDTVKSAATAIATALFVAFPLAAWCSSMTTYC